MSVFCIKCGLVIEEENATKKLYCPLCQKYREFIEFNSMELSKPNSLQSAEV